MVTLVFAHFRRMGIAYLVLVVALVSTFSAVNRIRKNIDAQDQQRFDRAVAQMQTATERRLIRCVDQMYNIRAFFAGSRSVETGEWNAYLGSMSVRHSELGIRTLGYLEKVTPQNKLGFLQRQRASGKTNFLIRPVAERPVYFPIVYVTHFDSTAESLYGLDHASRPERLEVIEQAIDSNQPLMTDRVPFMGVDGIHTNYGTMVYLPIYKNGAAITNVPERRDAAQGVIWMTIVPQTMLTMLFKNEVPNDSGVDVEVFDGTKVDPGQLLYDDDQILRANNPDLHPTLSSRIVLPVLNRKWTVSFSTTPRFDAASSRYLQWLTLSGGLIMSVLLFCIAWIQARARVQAEQAEEILAIEKEELDVTLFSIGDGVITTDTDTKVILINKAAQTLTGWTQKEAEGKPLAEIFKLIHENDRQTASNPVQKVLQTGEIVELGNHIALISRDGRERAIADSAAPIRDRAGKVIGVVLVFRDVTEKQKLESQLVKESKLESVGLLAGGIAHDFNNMLTAITANVSLARMQGTSPDERAQLLADAEKAAFRARDLTQQLLTFAKGGEPIKKIMRLEPFVREACEFALRGSNVQCQFSCADKIWPVEIDEGQFRQVLNNLVINARQAMPKGGKIDVHLENVELAKSALPPLSPGNYVKISVVDYGEGIKRELLPRIFEPYFTTKKGGSGLGLATAYSVVRKHDGLIKADSMENIGSTFQIFLPASNKRVTSLPQELPREKNLSGCGKILVMDDEIAVLKIIATMLKKFGYEVETALDGTEAIERYAAARTKSKAFDVVIMDLTIPNGMGGREAVKKLHELDPNVKAIVSSGYSLDPVMANHREHGFVGIIPKPYRLEDLSRVLQEVMGGDLEV